MKWYNIYRRGRLYARTTDKILARIMTDKPELTVWQRVVRLIKLIAK